MADPGIPLPIARFDIIIGKIKVYHRSFGAGDETNEIKFGLIYQSSCNSFRINHTST